MEVFLHERKHHLRDKETNRQPGQEHAHMRQLSSVCVLPLPPDQTTMVCWRRRKTKATTQQEAAIWRTKIKKTKKETKIQWLSQQLPCNPELIFSLNNATAAGFSQ